jgi:hypothetical protein
VPMLFSPIGVSGSSARSTEGAGTRLDRWPSGLLRTISFGALALQETADLWVPETVHTARDLLHRR